jgi:quercetin dioxygenase-like cupin family protein
MRLRALSLSVGLLLAAQVLALQAPVPVEQEPRHRLVFENAYIRVIDASVPPGDVTGYHVHARDNVPVVVSGGLQTVQPQGGVAVETTVKTGDVFFAAGGYTHRVGNAGTTTLRYIDAELTDSPPARSDPPPPPLAGTRGRRLAFENARVRVHRVRLQSGQSLAAHVHALPRLEVTVVGGTLTSGLGGGTERVETTAGSFAWYPAGAVHAIANGGRAPVELIEIELK